MPTIDLQPKNRLVEFTGSLAQASDRGGTLQADPASMAELRGDAVKGQIAKITVPDLKFNEYEDMHRFGASRARTIKDVEPMDYQIDSTQYLPKIKGLFGRRVKFNIYNGIGDIQQAGGTYIQEVHVVTGIVLEIPGTDVEFDEFTPASFKIAVQGLLIKNRTTPGSDTGVVRPIYLDLPKGLVVTYPSDDAGTVDATNTESMDIFGDRFAAAGY